MAQNELSKEDKNRIRNCEYYLQIKEVLKSHEEYKHINVGDVYFIKYRQNNQDGSGHYVSRTYGGEKDKFMIFHKDTDEFVFAKRINANGKLGKEVHCITTQYPGNQFILEPDSEFVDSILFNEVDGYDPFKLEKDLTNRKGKARRKNKKLEIKHSDANLAFKEIDSLNIGDVLYDARTTYGDGIIAWTVTDIEKRKVDFNLSYKDRDHTKAGLKEFVKLTLECKGERPKSRTWVNKKRTVTFEDFTKYGETYYRSMPFTLDDV